jgi:outer membrane lipoprotein-sorting protein
MTSTNADNKSTKQSGTYIGSVEKYIIESKNLTIINDGKTQWSIDHIDQEIRVNKIAVNKSKIESPMSIIQNYASLFKYRVKETIANGILILEMIPLNKNSNFFKVDLAIQVAKNQIVYVKLYDRGGNRIFYDILSTEENIKIQESDFALNKNKYKGYEELDLRQ